MSKKAAIAIVLCATFLYSCSPPTSQETPPQDIQVQTPLSTKTLEPSVTPNPSPSTSPTNTPVPPEISDAAKQSYLAMLMIQINSLLVAEAAERTQSGELSGVDQIGAVLAIAALIEGANQSIPEISPPDTLSKQWDKLVEVHEQTKEIMSSWFNDEIDSGDVLETIAPILFEADNILIEVEQLLSEEFNFDPDELTRERERILTTLSEIFESTPTPSP